MPNQEKIFKFLWPDKCWHTKPTVPPYSYMFRCSKCEQLTNAASNPDLTTPDGMVLMLDRLVEMGVAFTLKNRNDQYRFAISYKNIILHELADTAPFAVLSTVESLIEKEEKE